MEKYITKNGIKYELRGEQYYPMLADTITQSLLFNIMIICVIGLAMK